MPSTPGEPPALVTALLDPAAYPHPVDRVERVETHISWVFLAGEFAYKVKKPVDFGFLDFSTLEKRRACCEEELRLNRRLAPELYLAVVPLGGVGRLVVGGEPAREYAVKMRRFPEADRLDHMLEAGRLTPADMDALARRIAAFHLACPSAPAESPFGTPEAVVAPVVENFAQIAPLLAAPEDRARLEALRAATEAASSRLAPAFAARKAAGFVRECHGDMHLGNMVRWDGGFALFDGIEFNPNLSWVDVASDFAFLLMDLADRGHAPLAWRALDRWLEVTGDIGCLPVLGYYQSYRAMVRAKVAALRASQAGPEEAARAGLWEECHGYLVLAETFTRPGKARLLLTHGLSGSGKSAFAGALLEQLGAVRLRSDVERKRLFGLGAAARTDSAPGAGLYTADITGQTYAALRARTREALAAGFPVIVDATFLERARRDDFRALAREMGTPFHILTFTADPAVLRERVARREREGRDASEAGLEVLERQLTTAEPLAADEAACALAVPPWPEDGAGEAAESVTRRLEAA